MRNGRRLDTGDMLAQCTLPIGPPDTACPAHEMNLPNWGHRCFAEGTQRPPSLPSAGIVQDDSLAILRA